MQRQRPRATGDAPGRAPDHAHPAGRLPVTLDINAALEQLRNGEEPVRRRVVEDLGRSGRPEAITPLLLAVADESWPVRQAATELLAAFDETALLPHLEAALRDDEDAAM